MKLADQVITLELATKLKKLGLDKPSHFYFEWTGAEPDEIEWSEKPYYFVDSVNAYTVAELGEMLPNYFKHPDRGYINLVMMKLDDGRSEVMYKEGAEVGLVERAPTEADARAKMLIYLLENKLITL